MKLNRAAHDKCVKGFFLIDAVVRRRDMFYFIFEQERDEDTNFPLKKDVRTRVVYCLDDPVPEDIWGFASLRGMQRLTAGVSYQPKAQFVGVSLNDHVYVLGSGDDGLQANLQPVRDTEGKVIGGMRGGTHKSRTIDGWLWLAGSGRTIARRLGKDEWEWHSSIPYRSLMDDGGFNDIDGFSGEDIYAVGGHGDVWHFDGNVWKQMPFPSNMTLETVCCGGDGKVYIGAESGTLFEGRGGNWKMTERNGMTLPFRDMVWFQDKVWCTSDYGIWTIEKGKAMKPAVPNSVFICSGHLSVGDGVMLMAGVNGAVLYDGHSWQPIIDYNHLD